MRIMIKTIVRFVASVAMVICAAGCAIPSPESPAIQNKLKLISAGHTGCQPEENVISNVISSPNGDGQWNATCKGKTYLCTTVGTATGSHPYSCAPMVP